jgi:hypothetical protein
LGRKRLRSPRWSYDEAVLRLELSVNGFTTDGANVFTMQARQYVVQLRLWVAVVMVRWNQLFKRYRRQRMDGRFFLPLIAARAGKEGTPCPL